MTTITATEARHNFADLLREAESEVVQITQHNKPTAAVMSWEIYETLLETLEILIDPNTYSNIRAGIYDIDANRMTKWEEVRSRIIQTP